LISSKQFGGFVKPFEQILSLLLLLSKHDSVRHEFNWIEQVEPVKFVKQVQTKPVAIFAQIPLFSHGCDRQLFILIWQNCPV